MRKQWEQILRTTCTLGATLRKKRENYYWRESKYDEVWVCGGKWELTSWKIKVVEIECVQQIYTTFFHLFHFWSTEGAAGRCLHRSQFFLLRSSAGCCSGDACMDRQTQAHTPAAAPEKFKTWYRAGEVLAVGPQNREIDAGAVLCPYVTTLSSKRVSTGPWRQL